MVKAQGKAGGSIKGFYHNVGMEHVAKVDKLSVLMNMKVNTIGFLT